MTSLRRYSLTMFTFSPFVQFGRRAAPWCAGLLVVASATLAWHQALPALQPAPLLLAPMVSTLDHCLQKPTGEPVHTGCVGPQGSAADILGWTFRELGTPRAPHLELGYTLKLPLLDFLRPAQGDWIVDNEAVQRVARTVEQFPRPVVLYLFSTHFETGAPIEAELAQDPANLAATPEGPLPIDTYYGARLYPWSIARTDNSLTQRREQVIRALSNALCALPSPARDRIAGVTLLGETHQLYPRFETGMGFSSPYVLADYSKVSQDGFRHYLEQRFGQLSLLNQHLGSQLRSWDEIPIPTPSNSSTDANATLAFLDPFSHGILPVNGWVAPEKNSTTPGQGLVRVYVDGRLHSRATIEMSRQDVLAALPELGTANVGWRSDLDFSAWKPGRHRIDLLLERSGRPLSHLATREVDVLPAAGSPFSASGLSTQPAETGPMAGLPPTLPRVGETPRFSVDLPNDRTTLRYNPLAKLWHDYRNQQVVDYLQHFRQVISAGCLGQKSLFTHQLIPYFNPSWDAQRYAVDASLQPLPGLSSGISLYGEPAYGETFFRWRRSAHQAPYGVTEYHPLKAMAPQDLGEAFERHRRHGARFLSMFLEGHFHGILMAEHTNIFAFERQNKQFGSDRLYQSLKTVLNNPLAVEPGLSGLRPNSRASNESNH